MVRTKSTPRFYQRVQGIGGVSRTLQSGPWRAAARTVNPWRPGKFIDHARHRRDKTYVIPSAGHMRQSVARSSKNKRMGRKIMRTYKKLNFKQVRAQRFVRNYMAGGAGRYVYSFLKR